MQRSSWQDALDPVIDAAIAKQRIVGAVVLVSHRGEPVYRRAAGLAGGDAAQPMREDAIFRLASLATPVVSAAVLALVDGGRLSLDDAVTRYLPEFRPPLPDGGVPEIRLRHLLNPRPSVELDVVGSVLEAATGHSLPEVVRQLIGEPLGWRDTGFTLRDAARLATPHADDGDDGMVGTADETLAFFEALRSDNGLFLSPAWSRAMRQAPGPWQWDCAHGHCWLVDAAEELSMVTLAHTASAGTTGRFPDDLRAAIYRQVRR